jgi:hypothetical protein
LIDKWVTRSFVFLFPDVRLVVRIVWGPPLEVARTGNKRETHSQLANFIWSICNLLRAALTSGMNIARSFYL